MKPIPKARSSTVNPKSERRQAAVKAYHEGNFDPLERLCLEEIRASPHDDFAHTNLGVIRSRAGRWKEAESLYKEGINRFPRSATLHANYSKLCLDLRRWQEAYDLARKAASLNPKAQIAWLNASNACNMLGKGQEGEETAREAIALAPEQVGAWNNLANALVMQGRVAEAVHAYRKAIELKADDPLGYTNLMLALMYHAEAGVDDVVSLAHNFSARFEVPIASQCFAHDNVPLPERRLRIGFISPDFISHAVMYFAEPVLMRLPRQHFEVFCYFTYAAGDAVTERLKAVVDGFRYVPEPDPQATARMIHEDRIDILIDLAGHTAKNGLRAMAYKPAPVQMTWLGYPGTTGLKSIDWRITDHTADPPGADVHYTEKLVRLPGCFAVYRPHIRYPLHRFDTRYQVAESPALRNGHTTFGSCNNIAKISVQSVQAWCEVLRQVPGARMLIEGKDLGREEATRKLREMFAAGGVSEERLRFVQRDSANQYLTYHDIDIALDTFPLTGGTTTFDALWMGVPVVSMVGRTFRERLSMTILAHGGFGEEVCATVGQYVARAVALAGDVSALAARRREQRGRMQRSVLMDEARYVDLFGQSLRMVWRQWCRQREPDGVAAGSEPNKGQDVLVSVNGRRITMPAANAWLAKLASRVNAKPQPAPEDLAIRNAVAQAIFSVVSVGDPQVDSILGHNTVSRLEEHSADRKP
jgi:predicted O-linked N-acetylglucosamine transferase (SPINDLY family)